MTRLKALELFGFKSFADRTRFDFPEGITVVVGPNGSGKSNVVDGLKWVLGEQSARSLRGREMTDVIFAGSAVRRPLNAAEVSLIFDNSARQLPVEADEVQIMRRVYRSGESEYLVNGEISRLRDIRELFSGTGAATEAYSVIEQGRVDALLVASGRDRRAIFEEAAGITRFRARRAESLRRLERSEQNRQRLADIVGEVSSRLETVRHQAARARRWRQMTDRLRGLRLAAAARDLAEVDAAVSRVDEALASARAELLQIETQATRAAATAGDLEAVEQDLLPRLAEAQAVVTAEMQRAAAAEATLALLRSRRKELEGDATRVEEDLQAAVARQRSAGDDVDAAHRDGETLAAEAREIEDRLRRCTEAAEGTHQNTTDARERLAAGAAAVEGLQRQRLGLQSDFDRAVARVEEARRAAESCRGKIDAAHLSRARLLESRATWEGNLGAVSARLQAVVGDIELLEGRQREQAAALDTAWKELAGWKAKLEACRERRTMLEEIANRQEGLSDAARKLLADGAEGVPGLAGVVADLVVADLEWAPLVDLALGVVAQSLVVDSLDATVGWYAGWSSSEAAEAVLAAGGRIGFVAPDSLREPPAFDPTDDPSVAAGGVIGRLDRLLDAENTARFPTESHRTLIRRLLGRVWVVERMEQARDLAANAPAGTLLVTREGQCCSADGLFEVGTATAATGLVSRRSELRAVGQRHEELCRMVDIAERTVDAVQTELAAVRQEIRQAQSRRQQAAEEIATSRAEFERAGRETVAAEESIAAAESSLLAAERHASEQAGARDQAAATIEACDHGIAEARRELAAARLSLEALDRNRGEVIDEINALRIEQATCQERLSRAREAVTARAAGLHARRRDVEATRARRDEATRKLDSLDLDLLAAGAAYAEAMVAAESSTTSLTALTAARDGLIVDKQAAGTALADSRSAAARLGEAIHAHELESGEARHRRARIIERIHDEYDIDIDAAEPPPAGEGEPIVVPDDRVELDREIEELRRKLASMTSVNLEALAESEALTERLATLEAQLSDVTDAKRTIEQLIARIDEESRKLLGETIETVRGHFRELFERVFGGGQADIVLEPGVDLLETSVEIVARPPGKEPRNISLLSGGEKTMTCVALLLAIFRSRPSPFCVLDEVDAALDEANVDRFVGVLRDFLSSTQFIVVTHSKKTMATATTLYGVTMEESGVSKRVSVRFESTAAAVPRTAAKAA